MKKLISLIIIFSFCCSFLFSAGISSYATEKSGDFKYSLLVDGTAKITYIGKSKQLVIPATIDGYKVSVFHKTTNRAITSVTAEYGIKKISKNAFYYCDNLKKAVIPGSVKSIGEEAFSHCLNLKFLTLENGIKSIGEAAFFNCEKLAVINIPDSVTSIENVAFLLTKWEKIQPKGLVFAGNHLYDYKGTLPAKVVIPEGTKTICPYVFINVTTVKEVIVPGSIETIKHNAFDYCKSLKSVTIEDGVKTIEDCAFASCYKLSDIKIPDSVTYVGDAAFEETKWEEKQPKGFVYTGKSLYMYKGKCPEKVTIKDGTKSISPGAFVDGYKTLKKVTIPDSLEIIGKWAFSHCKNLKTVEIGKGVKRINSNAFYACKKLKNISLKEEVKYIGDKAFYACFNLTEITLPDTVTKLGSNIFYSCRNLKTVNIGKKLKTINLQESLFYNCKNLKNISVSKDNEYFSSVKGVLFDKNRTRLITYPNAKSSSYTVPEGVKIINNYAFSLCKNLKKITLPKGLKEIGYSAFYRSSVNEINFPKSLEAIYGHAFEKCFNLKKITLPENITTLGRCAFAYCINLEKVTFNAKNCRIIKGLEDEEGCYNSYIFNGNKKLERFVVGKKVEKLPADLLYDVTMLNLKKVVVPEKIEIIKPSVFDRYAFSGRSYAKPVKSGNTKVIRVSKNGRIKLLSNGTSSVTFLDQFTDKTHCVTFVVTL